jgi:hypothetical protein
MIKTPEGALVLALYLAITATTDKKSRECTEMADSIAARLSPETIERCKEQAEALLNSGADLISQGDNELELWTHS